MVNAAKNNLKLGLLNVRSLNTGRDELEAAIMTYQPDVLALNETWVREGQELIAPIISGYSFKHRARKSNLRGGGVGFYIKKGLRARIKPHPESQLEQLWLELVLPGARMAVGTAYRPESVKVETAIDALNESFSAFASCNYVFLLTDFNVDFLKDQSSRVQEIATFCTQRNLSQVVTEPTRITDDSESLIDLIITDSPEKCKKVTVVHNRCLSDHALVLCSVNVKKPKPTVRYIESRALSNINIEVFNCDLESIKWSNIISLSNVNDMIEAFNREIIDLFDRHAPVRRRKVEDSPKPWLTGTVRFMMQLRDGALSRAHTKKTNSSKEYYKSLKNLVTGAIDRERRAFFSQFVNKNVKNPAKLWKYLKSSNTLNNNNSAEIPESLNDPDLINSNFLNVPGDGLVDEELLAYFNLNKMTDKSFALQATTMGNIGKILLQIKTNASGHDNINIDMIKLTLPQTLPVITAIVNCSITTNIFPEPWKLALVRPIPKSKNVEQLKDLRPVSILPVLSKVLERVVLSQLEKYIASENIIPKFQSGFRKNYGTETALLQVTDDLITASDSGLSSVIVLLDFSRAFDCLDPKLLLAKLSYYGVSDKTCHWFKTYLADRTQYVETHNNKDGTKLASSIGKLSRGTPQGSILSPILFSLFTADMPGFMQTCKYHLYADDTQIYHSFQACDTDENMVLLNKDLENIYKWATSNSLVLNPSKSKMMVIGTKNQVESVMSHDPKALMNGVIIPIVREAKNLGLVMDRHLKFEDHINEKIRHSYYKLKILYNSQKYMSEQIKILLCDLIVLAPFNYCCAVYGPRLWAKTENSIQKVQNACARFCFNIPRRDHVTPYLVSKGILNMKYRRELHLACTTQKVLWNKRPEYLFDKMRWVRDIHYLLNVRSRWHYILDIPKHKTVGFEGCFRYRAAKIWNDLPPPLRKKVSAYTFKTKLKRVLLNRQKVQFEATFKIINKFA